MTTTEATVKLWTFGTFSAAEAIALCNPAALPVFHEANRPASRTAGEPHGPMTDVRETYDPADTTTPTTKAEG